MKSKKEVLRKIIMKVLWMIMSELNGLITYLENGKLIKKLIGISQLLVQNDEFPTRKRKTKIDGSIFELCDEPRMSYEEYEYSDEEEEEVEYGFPRTRKERNEAEK
jgi:hypothetical protein